MDQVKKRVPEDGEILERLVVEAVLLEGAGGELDDGGDDRGEAVDREDEIRVQEIVRERFAR